MAYMSYEEFKCLSDEDIITVRELDDMCREHGAHEDGMPIVALGFNHKMAEFCGKEAVVRGKEYGAAFLEGSPYEWSRQMLKPGHRSPVSFEDIQNEWNNLMFGES